jgi:hypothetical protein
MVGAEAPPQQRPEEKRKTYECQPPFREVFSLPQSKIENPLAASIAGRQLPPSLQSLPCPVASRAFFPHFQSSSKQFKANIFPLKTTMHSPFALCQVSHSCDPLPALQPRTPPSLFCEILSLPQSKIENRKSKMPSARPRPPPGACLDWLLPQI